MHYVEIAMTWLVNNSPGIIAAGAAFMSWRRSQQNATAISDVHDTINTNQAAAEAVIIAAAEKAIPPRVVRP